MGEYRSDPVVGDAVGRNLRRFMDRGSRPGVAYEVIERDDGFVGVKDVAYYFDKWDNWNEAERVAAACAKGDVLDVGVGVGRHAAHIRDEAGLSVTGIDASAGAVDIARSRGVDAYHVGFDEYLASRPDRRFDTFFFGGFNLGLLGDRGGATRRLEQMAVVASAGAQIVGVTVDPTEDESLASVAYMAWNRDRGRLLGQDRLRVRSGRITTGWFEYTSFSISDLEAIAEGTPWRLSDAYADKNWHAFVAVLELTN